MIRRPFRYLILLFSLVSITACEQYASIETVNASTNEDKVNINSSAKEMYNFKIATGERLISTDKENVFKADILNNKSYVNIQFDLLTGYSVDDYIVTGTDNSIVGSISNTQPYILNANIHEGENIIKIVDKKNNREVYRFNINYKKVQINGLDKISNIGDTNKVEAILDGKVYDNVVWSSGGTNALMVNKNGDVTAVNSGIDDIIGTLYDNKNEDIIGSIDFQINIAKTADYEWIMKDDKWYYINNDTKTPKTGWLQYDSQLYYLNEDGSLYTGWLHKDDASYYFKPNGILAIGWFKDEGKWYYAESNGALKKGWFKDHGNWYYLNENGEMQTSDITIDGIKFKFNKQGELQLGEE